jgi:hypothetical protein
MSIKFAVLLVMLVVFASIGHGPPLAEVAQAQVRIERDTVFAVVEGVELRLDVYLAR